MFRALQQFCENKVLALDDKMYGVNKSVAMGVGGFTVRHASWESHFTRSKFTPISLKLASLLKTNALLGRPFPGKIFVILCGQPQHVQRTPACELRERATSLVLRTKKKLGS